MLAECETNPSCKELIGILRVAFEKILVSKRELDDTLFKRRTKVEKGFNSDISWGGRSYHVQTEDWGRANPYLVSRVFSEGAVIKSIKTSYEEVLPRGPRSEAQSIRLAMKIQHQQILDLLISGQLL
jgi:hypothetical protein